MLEEKGKTGAEILLDVLNEAGVAYLFSHTGGAVIPIHVEISRRYRQGLPAPKRVMFRQEPGAGHAAEGYARVSGKPGVVIVTSGPGATNLVTPIADAYKDSIPCVFMTGQVSSADIGTDAFQEVPITIITEPITKFNYLVKDVNDLGWMLRQAFYLASTGRPGPVVVDICRNATTDRTTNGDESRPMRGYRPDVAMDTGKAGLILEALAQAERPVIKAGGGVISGGNSKAFHRFVKAYDVPVALTFMGLGAIPHDDARFLGMPGMHGTFSASKALVEADFILTIGGRFDDRIVTQGFGSNARVAHIDIDSSEINKVVKADLWLCADAGDFLAYALEHTPENRRDISGWWEGIRGWQRQHPLRYAQSENPIKPQYLIEQLSEVTGGDATIVTGVGQHQMWAAQFYRFSRPRQWVSSGSLGPMGYGLPAAIGAYCGNPGKPVVCIEGDGSFQMNMQELGTIMEYGLPIKTLIVNNGHLGMVREWEDLFFEGYHEETDLANPDFTHLDKVFRRKIETRRVTRASDVKPALEEMLSDDRPYVVDVWVDKDEDVLPIIPPGKGLQDMILE